VWLRLVALLVAALLASLLLAVAYGRRRWRADSEAARARLEASGALSKLARYDERELAGLPEPAARYLRRALSPGQPLVARVRLRQDGMFRVGEAEDAWRPFVASQNFIVSPPGFVWDARISMAPGLPVFVRDSYVAGTGAMRGELLGLWPMVDASGTQQIAEGALQRHLAETMWFPTALLPSQGVRWTPLDDSSALATLEHGATRAALHFRVDAAGDLLRVFSPSRYREVEGEYLPTPWAGSVKAVGERDGMRIPIDVEVEWQLPERRLPYFRGRVTEIAFEYVPSE
jgi:Family of unknown function (DUF6920)